MGSWLDEAEQRAEAAPFSSNPEVLFDVAEDAPRAYALIRLANEAVEHYWQHQTCPCGARRQSPATHSHVMGCPVGMFLAAYCEATEDRP